MIDEARPARETKAPGTQASEKKAPETKAARQAAHETPAARQAAQEAPVAEENTRLTRMGGDRGPSLAERLGDRIDRLAFSSPLHSLRLKGRFPLKLLGVPADPVPGDAARGQRLKGGRLFRDGYGQAMLDARLDAPDAPAVWREWVHGWGWLRDLATVADLSRTEAQYSEAVARRWLDTFHGYDETAWQPHLTGRRILMAISHAPLVMPGHDHIHRSAVLNGIARWARHLDRATPRMTPGASKVEAAAGLMGAALMLPGADEQLDRAERLLQEALADVLLPDGGPLSRSPLDLANLGDLLAHLTAFHAARRKLVSPVVQEAEIRVRAALVSLSGPDGYIGSWHGGQPDRAQIKRLAPLPDHSRQQTRLSGFQRMAAGTTLVLVDTGPPPLTRHNPEGHASTLAFTLDDGRHPLVVSCGAERGTQGRRAIPAALVDGLRSTAGHSTLVLADTNSSRLGAGGRRGGVEEVVAEYRHSGQGLWLEARHDGWRRRLGYDHQRRLWLAPDGGDLRGEDRLLPARATLSLKRGQLAVTIRFHLAPGIEAALTQDKMGALLRLPGRSRATDNAWAFRASFNHAPGVLSIEPSLHIDAEGVTHEIRQLLLTTSVDPGKPADISWSFRQQVRRG